MKNFVSLIVLTLTVSVPTWAQRVSAHWTLDDPNALTACTVAGLENYKQLISTDLTIGAKLKVGETMVKSSADSDGGFEPVHFTPAFTQFLPAAKATSISGGYNVSYTVKVPVGHLFKPMRIVFDASKCATDAGQVDVTYQIGSNPEVICSRGLKPNRNKIQEGNPDGYSTFAFDLGNVLVDGGVFTVNLYIHDVVPPKTLALRNLIIEGRFDEPIYSLSHYVKALTCQADGMKKDLMVAAANLCNGASAIYAFNLQSDPTDFQVTTAEGYTAEVTFKDHVATVTVSDKEGIVHIAQILFNGSQS